MRKKIILFLLILAVFFLIKINYFTPLKVGLVLSVGGESQPFNSAGIKGLEEAREKFGVKTDYKNSYKIAEIKRGIFYYAEKNYDLIIGLGFLAAEAIVEAAYKYPDSHFVLIDGNIKSPLPNLTVVKFNHKGGAFLAGVLSAMMTKKDKVGFIGGMPSAVVREFKEGFIQGVQSYADKEIEIFAEYVSSGPEGFSNPQRAYEIGNSMINKGADIIFAAAGGSGEGVINLARENKCYAIGVDINQDAEAPGRVLTSVMKQLHLPVIDVIEKKVKNESLNRNITRGLEDGGIKLTNFKYTKDIIGEENIFKIKSYEAKAEAVEKE